MNNDKTIMDEMTSKLKSMMKSLSEEDKDLVSENLAKNNRRIENNSKFPIMYTTTKVVYIAR